MHELKTPITRAKLITHTLDDAIENKNILLEVFLLMHFICIIFYTGENRFGKRHS